ncbi:MAG: sialate O-acetylesterase [bacterium]|nr:sialate O-acetylesterase [bacterium]
MAKVFVAPMMGQSNMFGQDATHAQVINPEYSTTPPDAHIWDKVDSLTLVTHVDDGAWTPLVLGMGFDNPPGSIPDAIGPEMEYHHRLQLDPEINGPIYYVKCCLGGTELGPEGAQQDWDPDSSAEMFDLFKLYYWKPAIEAIYANGDEPWLIGVFWGQGAADAQTTLALSYANNLIKFYKAINDVMGVPGANWVIQRETILSGITYPYLDELKQQQELAAQQIPAMEYFDSEQRTEYGVAQFVQHDGEHFNGEGQRSFGFYSGMLMRDLIRKQTMRRIPRPAY